MTAKEDLSKAYEVLREKVDVRDRTYKGETYPLCFVGSEATDVLEVGRSRSEAIEVGNQLLESGYFHHVLNEHKFKDRYLFYRFKEDEGKVHGETARLEDGEAISWASKIFPSHSSSTVGNLQSQSYIHLPDLPSSPADSKEHVAPAPLDEHNARLLDNVRPATWIDPAPHGKYNLVVIGAGAGGLVTAAGSAGVGAKVALIEEWMLGGDCLNVGCVPSKAIIRSAHAVHEVREAASLGVLGINREDIKVDFGAVMERMRKLRAEISHNDAANRFAKDLGVDVYQGRATFTGHNTVEVNGKTLEFSAAVIATGATSTVPPIKGLKDTPYMTAASIWNLTELPPRLAVIGAGSIGLEIGQAFCRFGSQVTIIARTGVAAKEDPDAVAAVVAQMQSEGIKFMDHCATDEVTHSKEAGFEVHYRRTQLSGQSASGVLQVDAVLIAAGKTPNVSNMGLEAADVKYDPRRGIVVNDKLQTSNRSIFAVGDVCTEYHFTHVADFMARLVIRNALFFGSGKMSSLLIPWVTYTDPEISHVGLFEADLKQRKEAYQVFKVDFKDVDRAILDSKAGFVKILTAEKKDTILGATIVGADAGNMISEITVAIQAGMGLGALASVIHPYPTQAEGIRKCGDLYNKSKLTPLVKTVFNRFLALRR
ncbi:Mercuric reductase [Coccomyxa sp. Obi]|nr:Mercuric reductase [Coccomyxa sp. Obi]